jgi:isopenicillin N synthase-like dioxygenase
MGSNFQTPVLPVVDFATWQTGSDEDRARIGAELRDACQRSGFVYVTNHGVPQRLVDEAFAVSRKFFEMPTEKKMLAPHPPCA